MTRHLLKLVWNRKRTTALVAFEMFVSFLVVFAVITAALWFINNYRRPLGYDYRNVLNITIHTGLAGDDNWTPEMTQRAATLLRELRAMPEVESAAGAQVGVFTFDGMIDGRRVNGRSIDLIMDQVTDDYARVMKLNVIAGRFFSAEDDAATYLPVVINDVAAKTFFGSASPIGKIFPDEERGDGSTTERRVIGVISGYRKDGELSGPAHVLISRKDLKGGKDRPPRNLLVRLRPGADAAAEQRIVERLQSVAAPWSLESDTLPAMRRESTRMKMLPVGIGGVLALFLMMMVGLGLLGVLWQSVQRRESELALRRALGAPRESIARQVVSETLLLAVTALIPAMLVVAQIPILSLMPWLPMPLVASATLISTVLMLAFIAACAYYPSRIATRIEPAVALRAE